MNIKILYEDNHLLVVEKPVNMLVQADKTEDEDLLTKLKAYIKKEYNKPGAVFLSIVHRIDRPVGGAIIYAKTSEGASRLADQLRRRVIEREYLGRVRGNIDKKLTAKLEFKGLGNKNNLSLLKIKLETGRSHQIRVQLAGFGFPLYGDQKYGAQINKVGQQIALWSHKLRFKHPTKDEMIEIVSNPPNISPWDQFKII